MGLRSAPGRRSARRDVRALVGWAAVAAALIVATWMAGPSARAQGEPDAETLQRGSELYAVNCAACHGPRGGGGPGERGLTAGPSIAGIERAYVDQQLRTGRMPLIDRTAGVVGPKELSDDDREAVLAWMDAELGLEGDIPEVGEGDASAGQELYAVHCAACHGAVGNGGVVGDGVTALGLRGVGDVAMAEAIRVGPYQMPAFGADLLDDQDVDDIVAYTSRAFEDPDRSLLGLTEQNRVGLSAIAMLLLLVVIGSAMLIARPVPMPTEGGEEGRE